jgi:hypothetical protein
MRARLDACIVCTEPSIMIDRPRPSLGCALSVCTSIRVRRIMCVYVCSIHRIGRRACVIEHVSVSDENSAPVCDTNVIALSTRTHMTERACLPVRVPFVTDPYRRPKSPVAFMAADDVMFLRNSFRVELSLS